jgi:hypothetical protein
MKRSFTAAALLAAATLMAVPALAQSGTQANSNSQQGNGATKQHTQGADMTNTYQFAPASGKYTPRPAPGSQGTIQGGMDQNGAASQSR